MPNNKRPIDDLVRESYDWWNKSYVFIKKTKIKTIYSVFILAFLTGAAIAIMWSVSSDVHQSSLAASDSDEKQTKQCNEFLKNAKKFDELASNFCKKAEKNEKYKKACNNYKAQAKKYKNQYNSRCLKHACEDSDGGKNYNKQGEIKFWPPIIGGATTQKDFCVIEESAPLDNYEFCSGEKCKLHEFFCQKKNTADERVSCEYGCLRGACVNEITINERAGRIEDKYISMQWETNIESNCMIAFGLNPDLSNSTSTLGLIARPFPNGTYSPFVYTADINGLTGGTTYYYKIMCSKGALKAETEIRSINTACSSIAIGNSKYHLEPCNIKEEIFDYEGNKDFSFNIIQEGERGTYSFTVYGYGAGFPTYGILGGASSGGATGNLKIDKYFNNGVLSATGPEKGIYKGYLPIRVSQGNVSGYKELRLNIDLKVKVPERIMIKERSKIINSDNVNIEWETNIDSSCEISYSIFSNFQNPDPSGISEVVVPGIKRISYAPAGSNPIPYIFSADLTGLKNGTTYYYQIKCNNSTFGIITSTETKSFNKTATVCPILELENSKYRLEPCSLTTEMIDGTGNKNFSFNIVQEGERRSYGFSVYGYGVNFPTYAILGGSSSGGAIGNLRIDKYFNDGVLSATGPEKGIYKGYLPIKVYHGSATGSNQYELRLNLNLTVKAASTTANVFDCTETDNGLDPYNVGTTKGYSWSPVYTGKILTNTDTCLAQANNLKVQEYVCKSTDDLITEWTRANNVEVVKILTDYKNQGIQKLMYWIQLDCPNGCINGACIK